MVEKSKATLRRSIVAIWLEAVQSKPTNQILNAVASAVVSEKLPTLGFMAGRFKSIVVSHGPEPFRSRQSAKAPMSLRVTDLTLRATSQIKLGFTLFELLLVLALLAIVGALALPTMDSLVTSRRLKNNTERIVLELSEARLEAIRTGQSQLFTALVGGREYSIKPWLDGYDEVNASAGAIIESSMSGQIIQSSPAGPIDSTNLGDEVPETLDSTVQFLAVDTLMDSRNAAAIETQTGTTPTAGASAANSSGESNPILFYPDGTSTTAKIQLADTQGRRMIIELRGVTGRINFYRAISVDPSTISSGFEAQGASQ